MKISWTDALEGTSGDRIEIINVDEDLTPDSNLVLEFHRQLAGVCGIEVTDNDGGSGDQQADFSACVSRRSKEGFKTETIFVFQIGSGEETTARHVADADCQIMIWGTARDEINWMLIVDESEHRDAAFTKYDVFQEIEEGERTSDPLTRYIVSGLPLEMRRRQLTFSGHSDGSVVNIVATDYDYYGKMNSYVIIKGSLCLGTDEDLNCACSKAVAAYEENGCACGASSGRWCSLDAMNLFVMTVTLVFVRGRLAAHCRHSTNSTGTLARNLVEARE